MTELRKSIIIAIDGFSSTGKSSFAKLIARDYGLLYLDSGALYRAVTLFAMENGFITDGKLDRNALLPFLSDLHLHFEYINGASVTFLGGRNVENDIRTLQVASNVSIVASDPQVRNFVDNILHSYRDKGGIIMDGRDIGTTVFPDADLKIFMTASTEVRARRRAAEMEQKGLKCSIEQVRQNLEERDWIDAHREASPLSRAPEAIELDNTDMTLEEQMDWIRSLLKEKFGLSPIR